MFIFKAIKINKTKKLIYLTIIFEQTASKG